MANQSAKKNQQQIKTPVMILTGLTYGATIWFVLWNIYYLLSQQISIWHILFCGIISFLNIFCHKTIVRYWQMQASQAAQYHLDILVMNLIVSIFDFWTHQVWHIYWLILVFILYYVGKWLWSYITPKYEENQQGQEGGNKKDKKQKKEKIKYIKK